MKQLEKEKDTLLQGLEMSERLREWYHKQIAIVTEKQNYVEKTSCSVCTLDTNTKFFFVFFLFFFFQYKPHTFSDLKDTVCLNDPNYVYIQFSALSQVVTYCSHNIQLYHFKA